MQAILASGQQSLRAMACCSRFSTLETPALETCSVLACAMPCMLLSSCRTLHPTSSQLKQQRQSQADSRASSNELLSVTASLALPSCNVRSSLVWRGATNSCFYMHNYWPSRRVPDITRPLALPVGCSLNVRCSPACCFVAVSSALGIAAIQCIWHRLWAGEDLVVRSLLALPGAC
jgi:hypothetical protein